MAEAFEEFGDLVYTRLVIDKLSGRPRGSLLVQCTTGNSTAPAMKDQQNCVRGQLHS